MADSKAPSDGACPVDHKAREAWLAQSRAAAAAGAPPPTLPHPMPPAPAQTTAPAKTWSQTFASYIPFSSSSSSSSQQQQPALRSGAAAGPDADLGTHRVVSSIPRSSDPDAVTACPQNREAETGRDEETGNWVYPSEKMFFDAMRRKGLGAEAEDMKTVVPIHNAVNERAWKEIIEWERPYFAGTPCDGPKLHSFAGLSTKMSPKARINTILGYTAPFDRHDWIVDRCGTRVEYVIDFYAGRAGPNAASPGPSFYLDVRPKLNTWEGVKMRFCKGVGLV